MMTLVSLSSDSSFSLITLAEFITWPLPCCLCGLKAFLLTVVSPRGPLNKWTHFQVVLL